ncbi:MAG TPA: four helix bundle protein [Anaerolineales bacterium]|nr:four helix bundle protein [Anaerolineales bacterium]
MMKDFRTLKVWEKAHVLTLAIYKSTENFPKQELYALTNQIQRAAVSIPTNIAEGCGKDSDAELKRYFVIAMGSSSELEYLLLLARDLGYLSDENHQILNNDLTEVRRMLNAVIQKLKTSTSSHNAKS